jgi:uncharacterized protein YndB with AHSA1/START domain
MTERTITTTLPSDTEITMSRTFDAPRHLVWAAMTQPQHIKRWWGRGNPLDVTLDFRPGGSYRFVEHADDGNDYAFRGEIREIVPEERVVQTFEYEGMPGHIAVETMTLEEKDGRTTVTNTSAFSSKEDRDGMLSSGMETGANQSYDALEALLAELQR